MSGIYVRTFTPLLGRHPLSTSNPSVSPRGTVNLRSCRRSANHISLIGHTRPGESRRRTGENRPRIAQVDSAAGIASADDTTPGSPGDTGGVQSPPDPAAAAGTDPPATASPGLKLHTPGPLRVPQMVLHSRGCALTSSLHAGADRDGAGLRASRSRPQTPADPGGNVIAEVATQISAAMSTLPQRLAASVAGTGAAGHPSPQSTPNTATRISPQGGVYSDSADRTAPPETVVPVAVRTLVHDTATALTRRRWAPGRRGTDPQRRNPARPGLTTSSQHRRNRHSHSQRRATADCGTYSATARDRGLDLAGCDRHHRTLSGQHR